MVIVVDESGLPVDGTPVGRDKPGLVGGRVEVTNAGGAEVAVSWETLMHDPRLKLVSRIAIQIFFIAGMIVLGKHYKVPHNLLNVRFEFQATNHVKAY
jgi:hypothetical protein